MKQNTQTATEAPAVVAKAPRARSSAKPRASKAKAAEPETAETETAVTSGVAAAEVTTTDVAPETAAPETAPRAEKPTVAIKGKRVAGKEPTIGNLSINANGNLSGVVQRSELIAALNDKGQFESWCYLNGGIDLGAVAPIGVNRPVRVPLGTQDKDGRDEFVTVGFARHTPLKAGGSKLVINFKPEITGAPFFTAESVDKITLVITPPAAKAQA